MQFIRTNLSPGMIVLLVILAILFAAVVIPVLVIGGFCWYLCSVITGSSPREIYLRRKARCSSRVYEGPSDRDRAADYDSGASAASDDTIECEVISARTFDENGREIR